jgi:hypothetical protein
VQLVDYGGTPWQSVSERLPELRETRTHNVAARTLHVACGPVVSWAVASPQERKKRNDSEATGDPSQDRVLVKQHRTGPSRHTTSRKILPMLAASAVLGVAAIAPNAALAFLPPPPPGPPPELAGPPPGLAGAPPGLGGLPRPGLGGPAGLSRLAGPSGFTTTATTVGETAPTAFMSAAAVMVLPMPAMTAATTPTTAAGASWFAPATE